MNNEVDVRKDKWKLFCKKHATRIAYLPQRQGKKVIPAMWIEKIQDWVWLTRAQRRHLERKNR